MNSLIESEFPLQEAQKERYDLMGVLTDSDLTYGTPQSAKPWHRNVRQGSIPLS